MFIINDTTGDMTVRQGDTWVFTVSGISDDWDVYYSVYRASDRAIVFEISAKPENEVTTFNVTAGDSNKLEVPADKKTELYYYGIKRCKDGVEDTVIVGNKTVDGLNKVIVYPLITQGEENGSGENS